MTTSLVINESEEGLEKSDLYRQSNQTKEHNIFLYDINPYQKIVIISPKNLEGKTIPENFLKYLSTISQEAHDNFVLDNAVANLEKNNEQYLNQGKNNKAEMQNSQGTTHEAVLSENGLESMVNAAKDYNSFQIDNFNINNYGATLAEPEGVMAHATVAGARFLNNLGKKVNNAYNKVKSINSKAAKKAGLAITTIALVAALSVGCSGVTPEPPGPPHGDIADSHKVTAIAPYYEIEEEKGYCLISKGAIVANYESSQKVLTQKELADAIFGTVGAKMSDLVSYINSRQDLNLKAEIQYLSILEIQRMLEDDIVPIVSTKSGTSVYLPVGYDKLKEEITNYATLTGNEITANQFDMFYENNNKSVIIINKEKLPTYLDNLL